MFEITGDDIAALTDADLRTLVSRLAIAELGRQVLPISGVTAGGNQDAADGGLDVRVVVQSLPAPDFIPRCATGFQVKKPNMPASAIKEEMRPKGTLRPVISELARAGGAYIIFSAQGSVADGPLAARRSAMRDAIADDPNASALLVDFYDRERMATWASQYAGVAAWVRARLGRGLSGWRSVGNWKDGGMSGGSPYLQNDHACLIDERSKDREKLPIGEGITRLREALAQPRQAVRLIGLSGLGKTRLVQALFETGVTAARTLWTLPALSSRARIPGSKAGSGNAQFDDLGGDVPGARLHSLRRRRQRREHRGQHSHHCPKRRGQLPPQAYLPLPPCPLRRGHPQAPRGG